MDLLTGSLPGDPPLLQELGIEPGLIWGHILSSVKLSQDVRWTQDSDLAGPILLNFLLGLSLLLSAGKSVFGFIYGIATLGAISFYLLLNLLSSNLPISLISTYCILGYGLTPLLLFVLVNALLPSLLARYLLALVLTAWSTASASNLFVHGMGLREQAWLVAYPVCLFFTSLTILILF